MTIHTFYFDARLTRLSSLMAGAAQPLGRLEHFCEPILGRKQFLAMLLSEYAAFSATLHRAFY